MRKKSVDHSFRKRDTYKKDEAGRLIGGGQCINDLRDKFYNEKKLNKNEKTALSNYDNYRLRELEKCHSDEEFHAKYIKLQVMANMANYKEFLKEKYRV